MCGSVALIADSEQLEATLRHALSQIEARGPDGIGLARSGGGALGHCRLSLRDAAGGGQPRALADGRLLAYVGELYNDARLKAILELEGWKSATSSDTEILARALEKWGNDAWDKLDGMFAVTVLSSEGDALELVRDRFGIKPLYFRRGSGTIAAASEPAALLHREPSRTAARSAVIHFLRTSHIAHGMQTVWNDISLVPPGSRALLTQESSHIVLWTRHRELERQPIDAAHASSKLKYLLGEAVYRQKQADCPVGLFLSGGVDSSLLAAFLAQQQQEPVKTYAVALVGDTDDLKQADLMARHISADHAELVVSPDEFFEAMRTLTIQRALPVSLPNEVLIYLLAKRAKQDVKAVLCGEGADELFGGYHRLQARLHGVKGDWPSTLRAYRQASAWFSSSELQDTLLDGSIVSDVERADFDALSGLAKPEGAASLAQALLLHDHYPHLLLRLDGATMAAGLEGRVPFADRDVVSFAEALPQELLLPAFGLEKPILRKAGHGSLPDEIMRRPKRAFSASLSHLFSASSGQQALERALHEITRHELFDEGKLNQLLAAERETPSLHRTWLICSLGLWLDACRVRQIC
ncbi:MAG: asparagine synthase (glutamine-hydrolyzing) [bacterium]|nr:asparagine synthase (glutamine-hydrolyzing) [bacterium]